MKLDDITEEMLDEVKEKLFVSWDDDDTKIKNIIIRASAYVQSKVSYILMFVQGSAEYDLFLERCRYDWNNALDEFEKNYSSEILSVIQFYALKDWRERNVESTD